MSLFICFSFCETYCTLSCVVFITHFFHLNHDFISAIRKSNYLSHFILYQFLIRDG